MLPVRQQQNRMKLNSRIAIHEKDFVRLFCESGVDELASIGNNPVMPIKQPTIEEQVVDTLRSAPNKSVVADETGIHKSAISRIAAKKRRPALDSRCKLADYWGMRLTRAKKRT